MKQQSQGNSCCNTDHSVSCLLLQLVFQLWHTHNISFPSPPPHSEAPFFFFFSGKSVFQHFHFPFCESSRLGSTCWCQMHCLRHVSVKNSQLHSLKCGQKVWQEVPKADLKAHESVLLVVQRSALIHAKGSFLIIIWHYHPICWKMSPLRQNVFSFCNHPREQRE